MSKTRPSLAVVLSVIFLFWIPFTIMSYHTLATWFLDRDLFHLLIFPLIWLFSTLYGLKKCLGL